MPPVRPLSINLSLVNHLDDDNDDSSDNGYDNNQCETTYRQDGLSIGANYLRIDGSTFTRDQFNMMLESTLGRGSCSKVFKAQWAKENHQPVALKQFSHLNCDHLENKKQKQMLATELVALSRINCECLVKLLGAYFQDNTASIVLEYMNMGSLETSLLSEREPVPDSMLASIAYQMLWGISYLHHERMLHRDIKPANVLLSDDGRVKVTDFGIAALASSSNTNGGDGTVMNTTVIGTTRYLSPERLEAKPYSRPADIWGFALVLLECTLGISPLEFITSQIELIQTIRDMDSFEEWIPSSIDPELQQLLLGCLQKEPEKRMPAHVLLQAPWFESHGVRCVEDAVNLMKKSLSSSCTVSSEG